MVEEHLRIGKYMKKKRLGLEMTQSQVADVLGIQIQSVSNVERGVSPISRYVCKEWMGLIDADPKYIKKYLMQLYEKKVNKKLGIN